MVYALIRESWPIAKKKHVCIWCGEAIPVGTKYRHEISRYDDIQNHHWHLECDEAAKEYFRDGADEFYPYSNERPLAPSGLMAWPLGEK